MQMEKAILFITVHVYSALLQVMRVVLAPVIQAIVPRYQLRDRCRLVAAHREFRGHTVVWLHAASLGEAKVLIDFLRILSQKHPEYRYVVTATSVAGVQFLRRCTHEAICAAGFLPIDTISCMRGMIERFSVSRVWLIETELWPSMLWVCLSRSIPVGIANARLEEKSLALYRRFGFMFRPIFRRLAAVLAQSEAYAQRFTAMGVDRVRISVIGNMKGRVTVRRPSLEEWMRLRRHMNAAEGSVVITAGCIHAEEGLTIRGAIDRLQRDFGDWKWIIVPRYLNEIEALMEALGAEAVLVKEPFMTRDWRVCVVGAYGVLENLYRIADAAVIGGTFMDTGGHNVWEAAQFGIPVMWGPNYHTQRESCERLRAAGVGFEVGGSEELAHTLIRVLKTDAKKFIRAQCAFIEQYSESTKSLEHAIP